MDPTLPIGFNDNDSFCWQDWRQRQQGPWGSRLSWFDEHHSELLAEVFPGFWQVWENKPFCDAMKTIIYWYIRSNDSHSGIDGGIVLSQAALENLAWTVLVQNSQALSEEGFNKLSAADQIRLLLNSLNIPRSIPPEFTSLAKISKELNWDGPEAFTQMRNSMVHPGKMVKTKSKLRGMRLPMVETWNLGQWYIELALLSLFQHKGIYAERYKLPSTIGVVAKVPWAS